MSRDGSGNFNLIAGNPVTTGTTIASTWANDTLSDIATALTNSIAKNGETIPTGNLPMGGFKHTNVANASARTDYAAYGQVQDSGSQYLTGVAGADTITASLIGLAAYATGQTFRLVSAGANTGAVTLNLNGLGAKTVAKWGALALSAGDIASGAVVEVVYDGTNFQLLGVSRSDASPIVVDDSDATKVLRMSLGNLTTATTRTLTLQDKSGIPALLADLTTPYNAALAASVNANALTVSLKNIAGNDASAGDPVYIPFRSATVTSGTPTVRAVTAALSVVAPQGATLGFAGSTSGRLHVYAVDNAGTVTLAVYRAESSATVVPLDECGVVTTTAIGTGSDSAQVPYSTAGHTNCAVSYLGYIEITPGATPGDWSASPTVVMTYRPGVKKPGDVVAVGMASTGEADDFGNIAGETIPLTDAIPQITAGTQILACTVAPKSALNIMRVDGLAYMTANSGVHVIMALFTGGKDAVAAMTALQGNANTGAFPLTYQAKATVTSITYSLRAGPATSAVVTLNGQSTARLFGGVFLSSLQVTEIWS